MKKTLGVGVIGLGRLGYQHTMNVTARWAHAWLQFPIRSRQHWSAALKISA